jgi:DNA-binding MarR family transcriptional regulator
MTFDPRSFFHDFVRLEIELWNLVESRLLAVHSLPLSWYEPMLVISETSNCRVLDIADRLSITVGGVSKLVDRIESAAYCKRIPHPVDGRSSGLVLTQKGVSVLNKASGTLEEVVQEFLESTLNQRTRDQYFESTRELLYAIKKRG